tara:strand:+ start:2191 stop:2439 length:249 start_codon:yes stop_codon:yes gene_type:complete
MTENSIKKLGFEKCVIDQNDSGLDRDIYYYTYNVGSVCFISNDTSDGKGKSNWEVEIPGSDVVFNTVKDLQCVIECLERNRV